MAALNDIADFARSELADKALPSVEDLVAQQAFFLANPRKQPLVDTDDETDEPIRNSTGKGRYASLLKSGSASGGRKRLLDSDDEDYAPGKHRRISVGGFNGKKAVKQSAEWVFNTFESLLVELRSTYMKGWFCMATYLRMLLGIFLHTKFVSGPAWLQGKVEQLLLDQPQLTVIIDYFIEKRVLDEFYCLLCEVTSSSSMDPWFADQHKSADDLKPRLAKVLHYGELTIFLVDMREIRTKGRFTSKSIHEMSSLVGKVRADCLRLRSDLFVYFACHRVFSTAKKNETETLGRGRWLLSILDDSEDRIATIKLTASAHVKVRPDPIEQEGEMSTATVEGEEHLVVDAILSEQLSRHQKMRLETIDNGTGTSSTLSSMSSPVANAAAGLPAQKEKRKGPLVRRKPQAALQPPPPPPKEPKFTTIMREEQVSDGEDVSLTFADGTAVDRSTLETRLQATLDGLHKFYADEARWKVCQDAGQALMEAFFDRSVSDAQLLDMCKKMNSKHVPPTCLEMRGKFREIFPPRVFIITPRYRTELVSVQVPCEDEEESATEPAVPLEPERMEEDEVITDDEREGQPTIANQMDIEDGWEPFRGETVPPTAAQPRPTGALPHSSNGNGLVGLDAPLLPGGKAFHLPAPLPLLAFNEAALNKALTGSMPAPSSNSHFSNHQHAGINNALQPIASQANINRNNDIVDLTQDTSVRPITFHKRFPSAAPAAGLPKPTASMYRYLVDRFMEYFFKLPLDVFNGGQAEKSALFAGLRVCLFANNASPGTIESCAVQCKVRSDLLQVWVARARQHLVKDYAAFCATRGIGPVTPTPPPHPAMAVAVSASAAVPLPTHYLLGGAQQLQQPSGHIASVNNQPPVSSHLSAAGNIMMSRAVTDMLPSVPSRLAPSTSTTDSATHAGSTAEPAPPATNKNIGDLAESIFGSIDNEGEEMESMLANAASEHQSATATADETTITVGREIESLEATSVMGATQSVTSTDAAAPGAMAIVVEMAATPLAPLVLSDLITPPPNSAEEATPSTARVPAVVASNVAVSPSSSAASSRIDADGGTTGDILMALFIRDPRFPDDNVRIPVKPKSYKKKVLQMLDKYAKFKNVPVESLEARLHGVAMDVQRPLNETGVKDGDIIFIYPKT